MSSALRAVPNKKSEAQTRSSHGKTCAEVSAHQLGLQCAARQGEAPVCSTEHAGCMMDKNSVSTWTSPQT